jgi:hypothetical protein
MNYGHADSIDKLKFITIGIVLGIFASFLMFNIIWNSAAEWIDHVNNVSTWIGTAGTLVAILQLYSVKVTQEAIAAAVHEQRTRTKDSYAKVLLEACHRAFNEADSCYGRKEWMICSIRFKDVSGYLYRLSSIGNVSDPFVTSAAPIFSEFSQLLESQVKGRNLDLNSEQVEAFKKWRTEMFSFFSKQDTTLE